MRAAGGNPFQQLLPPPGWLSEEDLFLMGEIDRQYLKPPFYGSRRMKAWLKRRGVRVNRKRVQRLMRGMGLRAIYRKPGASRSTPGGQSLSTPVEKGQNHPAQPGVGGGHHLPGHGPVDSSTWWPSWTGTVGTWWLGGCPTHCRPAFAPRRWRRPWPAGGLRCSIPDNEASSPAWSSPRSSRSTG